MSHQHTCKLSTAVVGEGGGGQPLISCACCVSITEHALGVQMFPPPPPLALVLHFTLRAVPYSDGARCASHHGLLGAC
jgi:hypothetical protein